MDGAAFDIYPTLRLAVFFALLLGMGCWELLRPYRPQIISKGYRWLNNLGLSVVNSVLVVVLVPTTLLAFAAIINVGGYGLFNLVTLPGPLEVALAVLLLDLVIYGQHRLFHAVPWLWRLHRLHHADPDFDVTTGIRFHPIEILISIAIKMALILLLGVPVLAVALFEILLNATAMFNHGNVRLPSGLDGVLRLFVVTPDMHRVHHSINSKEHNSNFGFNFPWWDRLFASYQAQPELGHDHMQIGLEIFQGKTNNRLDNLLLQPFRNDNQN